LLNVLSALSLFAALLYIYMGFFIFRAKSQARINRVFLLWCISMSVWSVASGFSYITVTSHNFWVMVSAVGWCFFGAFSLHLVMLLTDIAFVRKPAHILIYLPGMVFWCLSLIEYGSDGGLPENLETFYYTGNNIQIFTFPLLTIGLLISWYIKNKSDTRIKNQARILLLTSSVSFIFVSLSQQILPALGIINLPYMSHLFALLVLFGVYYAMKHYRLFSISPQILNDMIFSEMMDLAVLISTDGKIQKISRSTEELLGYSPADLIDKPFTVILGEPGIFSDMMDAKDESAVSRHNNTICLTRSGNAFPVSLSFMSLVSGRLKEPEGFVILGHDMRITKQLEEQIEEQKIIEEQLRQSEQRFKDMFYHNTVVMYLVDCDTLEIFEANNAAREFYGISESALGRIKITDLNGFSDEKMRKILNDIYKNKRTVYHFKHRAAGGAWRDVEVHSTLLFMNNKRMLISIVTDITDRKKAEEKITYLAYHDALTGLANRKYFYEKLHAELERSFRKGGRVAVLFMDLDNLKQINDTYGHEAGDLLLKEVADRIKSSIRKTDLAARMGGDEFTLLITDIKSREDAIDVSGKIYKLMDTPFYINDIPVKAQISIGISIFPDDGSDVNQLIGKADNEMYAVKNRKKRNAASG